MSKSIVLTAEERKAIAALKRLAKRWPQTLGLFSASGSLCVIRLAEDGSFPDASGGVDPAAEVDCIYGIPNDGGDW